MFRSKSRKNKYSMPAPEVCAEFTNLKTRLYWTSVDGADGYCVYRRCGRGMWKLVCRTRELSCDDIYRDLDAETLKANQALKDTFIDPAHNRLVYTVRAYRYGGGGLEFSDYKRNGVFYLDRPVIISAGRAGKGGRILRWATVPNARKYRVYLKYEIDGIPGEWVLYKTVAAGSRDVQSLKVPGIATHYAVQAAAYQDGRTALSDFEESFCVETERFADKSILCVGDSIVLGVPYHRKEMGAELLSGKRGEKKRSLPGTEAGSVFSFPFRIAALTGAAVSNRGINAAGWHYEPVTPDYNRKCLLTDVIMAMSPEELAGFDVVILEGGTNDYKASAAVFEDDPAGCGAEEGCAHDIGTFAGALRECLDCLERANRIRLAGGRDPMKVIFFDITYSCRMDDYTVKTDRDITLNDRGYTLMDYQEARDQVMEERMGQTSLELFRYRTRLYGIVSEITSDLWTADNLHMTRKAYAEYGSGLVKFMVDSGVLA